jgi:hypothetical protein
MAYYATITSKLIFLEKIECDRGFCIARQRRAYTYDEIIARDKVNLDIFWLRDESLEDTENLPAPDVLAVEIVEELEAALEQFRLIAEDMGELETTPN